MMQGGYGGFGLVLGREMGAYRLSVCVGPRAGEQEEMDTHQG